MKKNSYKPIQFIPKNNEQSNNIKCHTIVCNEAIQVRHKHNGLPNKVGTRKANFCIKYKILPNLVDW